MVNSLTLKLTLPTPELEQAYLDYVKEWEQNGEKISPFSIDPQGLDFKTWLEASESIRRQETCPPNLVPADTYFLIDNAGRILGAINIRHRLNDWLLNFGGHIGYGVRPSEREKGHATLMLKLALEKCRELGLEKVLLTCDKENTASVRIINANCGVLENEMPDGERTMLRYWIVLGEL
ncbi:MAG: GNAT family N-acetyltransferase [Thermoplasmata archaeon]|nr:GNAT family N-acetyltransferase [Thermoplasmata archaeon]